MRRVHPFAPFAPLAILAALAAVTWLGCAHGVADDPVEDTAAQQPVQATQIEVPTVPAYIGVSNSLTVDDETPWIYTRFELIPKGKVSIALSKDKHDPAGPVSFKIYHVQPNGHLRYYRTVDGASGLAQTTLRSVNGGLYVVEVVGEPHPAHLWLDLACMTERCSPKRQPNEMCGGIAAFPCDDGLVCQHPDATCGYADGSGTCAIPPQVCLDVYQPVCDCNGTTYGNRCEAQKVGATIDHEGACAVASCRPYCGAKGTRSEGWYDGCTDQLIKYAGCAGAYPYCSFIGTDAEGWSSTADGGYVTKGACSQNTLCEGARGGCAPTYPNSCPAGWVIADGAAGLTCGEHMLGLWCCVRDCPQLARPAPGFCPDGAIVANYDMWGICITSYDCV
jgi:hypothetical protein